MQTTAVQPAIRPGKKITWRQDFRKNWLVYLIMLPALVYLVIFQYLPMFGIVMAFEDFSVAKGYFGSDWIWFENFIELFTSEEFPRALRNTLVMGALNLTIGFVMPILFAFLLSMLNNRRFKRTIQTCSYIPNFLSAVVVCSLATQFLDRDGALTQLLTVVGFKQQNWLANGDIPVFWIINTFMNVWTGIGWGSIVYVASIATISGELHEAAAIDGATRFQRMTKITLPCIMPMIVMMLTLQVGISFVAGFDKVLLLYKPITYETADCLSTYTYRLAFGTSQNYGLSSASGLFQSVVATTLLILSNYLNRKVSGSALF